MTGSGQDHEFRKLLDDFEISYDKSAYRQDPPEPIDFDKLRSYVASELPEEEAEWIEYLVAAYWDWALGHRLVIQESSGFIGDAEKAFTSDLGTGHRDKTTETKVGLNQQIQPKNKVRLSWTKALSIAAVLIGCLAATKFTVDYFSTAPKLVAKLLDQSGVSSIDENDKLIISGREIASNEFREAIRDRLVNPTLPWPKISDDLIGDTGGQVRSTSDSQSNVASPFRTAVFPGSVALKWPLSGGNRFRVEIFSIEDKLQLYLKSPDLEVNSWDPTIEPGKYQFQVSVFDGKTPLTPIPSSSEPFIRFEVVDESIAASVKKKVEKSDSHLVNAIIYADAGMYHEADQQLAYLAKLNSDVDSYERVKKMQNSLSRARGLVE